MFAIDLGRKLPRIATAILLASAVGACSTAQDIEPVYEMNGKRQSTSSDDLHKSGIEHLRAGRFGLALHDLRKALQQDPDSVSTLNAIAIGYDELQRFDLSKRYYVKSLALDPESVQTLNNMGNSLLRQRKVKEALAYFEKARSIEDRNATVRANLESAQQRLDRVASVTKDGGEHSTKANIDTDTEDSNQSEETEHVASTNPVWIERTSPNVQTLVTKVEPEDQGTPEPSDVRPSDVSFRQFDMPIGPGPDERPSVSSPTVLSRSSWGPPLLLEASRVEEEAARLFHQMYLEMGSDAPVHEGVFSGDVSITLSAPPDDSEKPQPVRTAALAMAPVRSDGDISIERAIRTRKIETHVVAPEPIEAGIEVKHAGDDLQREPDVDDNRIQVPELADVRYVERVPTSSVRVRSPVVQVSALGKPPKALEMLVDTVASDSYRRADRMIMSDLPDVAPVPDRVEVPDAMESSVPEATFEDPATVPAEEESREATAGANEPANGPRPVTQVASLGFVEVERDASPPAHSPMVGIGSFSIEVSNGTGRRHMAARLNDHLTEHGLPDAILTNAVSFNFMRSVIFYRPGFELAAGEVASTLPFRIDMQEYENKYADIRVRLGGDLLSFDESLLTAMKGQ